MKKKSLILYTYYVSGVDSSLLFIFDAKEEEYQVKLVRFDLFLIGQELLYNGKKYMVYAICREQLNRQILLLKYNLFIALVFECVIIIITSISKIMVLITALTF